MNIDKTGSIAGALSIMRGELRKRISQSDANSDVQQSDPNSLVERSPHDLSVLQADLVKIVESVDIDRQTSIDAAKPKIFRAILLWEFGHSLRNHSEWQTLMDRIQVIFQENKSLELEFIDLIQELKNSA